MASETNQQVISVDLDELQKAFDVIARVNSVPLDNIAWHKDGEFGVPTAEKLANWRFVGMSNASFAETYLLEGE